MKITHLITLTLAQIAFSLSPDAHAGNRNNQQPVRIPKPQAPSYSAPRPSKPSSFPSASTGQPPRREERQQQQRDDQSRTQDRRQQENRSRGQNRSQEEDRSRRQDRGQQEDRSRGQDRDQQEDRSRGQDRGQQEDRSRGQDRDQQENRSRGQDRNRQEDRKQRADSPSVSLKDMRNGDTRTRGDGSVDKKVRGGFVNTRVDKDGSGIFLDC